MEKVYLVWLNYDNGWEDESYFRVAKTRDKAIKILKELKERELKESWLANYTQEEIENKFNYYEDLEDSYVADDTSFSGQKTEISIEEMECEE